MSTIFLNKLTIQGECKELNRFIRNIDIKPQVVLTPKEISSTSSRAEQIKLALSKTDANKQGFSFSNLVPQPMDLLIGQMHCNCWREENWGTIKDAKYAVADHIEIVEGDTVVSETHSICFMSFDSLPHCLFVDISTRYNLDFTLKSMELDSENPDFCSTCTEYSYVLGEYSIDLSAKMHYLPIEYLCSIADMSNAILERIIYVFVDLANMKLVDQQIATDIAMIVGWGKRNILLGDIEYYKACISDIICRYYNFSDKEQIKHFERALLIENDLTEIFANAFNSSIFLDDTTNQINDESTAISVNCLEDLEKYPLPPAALLDIYKRIIDWLGSGGTLDDDYIKNNYKYAEKLLIRKQNEQVD